jgi:fructose 1,6-bisphosphate aldolase/phosphatase
MAKNKITVSVIKADIGSVPGHNRVHPKLLETAKKHMKKAKRSKLLVDYYVTACGDDLELIMTHRHGVSNKKVHTLAWDIFMDCTAVAKSLKLYGAGQDILSTAFSGNVKGMGPGVAEMEFEERGAEPLLVFMADKTDPGAWNYILYKVFADPFNTAGLVISPKLHDGFVFEVHDLYAHRNTQPICR